MEKHDSFSILHTMAYSVIAIQQMNLVHKFPSIYWKTACLSVNAGAINEEDYYNLVEEGVIEISDDQDIKSNKKNQYGKVASAIGDMRGNIEVRQPDINKSKMGFTPDRVTNTILYGLKGITKLGDKVIAEIILNRPYESLNHFVKKMLTEDGKKVISKDRVVYLIKSGAFDDIEKRPREEILYDFVFSIADRKNVLNLRNFQMLMRENLVPDLFTEEKKCYNFTKYIRKARHSTYYLIDEIAKEYLLERFPPQKIIKVKKDGEELDAISSAWWDSLYNNFMNPIRKWIKENHDHLLEKLNKNLFQEEYDKYAKGNILDWELESLNFFYSGHPLNDVTFPIKIDNYNDIMEDRVIGYFIIQGKKIPELELSTIAGTVIDKDKVKGVVTLATKEAVVDIKLFKQMYTKYSHEVKDVNGNVTEEDFFKKGTHLVITGIKRGDMFVPKVYKKTGLHPVLKVIVEDNKFVKFVGK